MAPICSEPPAFLSQIWKLHSKQLSFLCSEFALVRTGKDKIGEG